MENMIETRNKLFEEFSKENGHFIDDEGEEYALIEQAYCDGPMSDPHYTALAIRLSDPVDEDNAVDCYRIRWEIIDEETEDACDACDWDSPSRIEKECGYFVDERRTV